MNRNNPETLTKISQITTKIYIGAHTWSWGTPFTAVPSRFSDLTPLPAAGGWPNARYALPNAYTFPARTVSLRAPQINRPVMQIIFDLAPVTPTNPHFWYDQLRTQLGPATQANTYATTSSSQVAFSASWAIPDVHLTLSVYGGPRPSATGDVVAGLFITWENEIAAAAPYLADQLARQHTLQQVATVPHTLTTYTLTQPQTPYYLPRYHATNPHASSTHPAWRLAQKVLYRPQLLDTPAPWQAQLSPHQIGVWQAGLTWGVSNHWDTIYLMKGQEVNISWSNLLPAKGGGQSALSMGDFNVVDKHSSPTIAQLVTHLTTITGKSTICYEAYDV